MKIAFVGDLTVDRYPELQRTHLGGSSLNSAMWASKAATDDVSVFAAVGDDADGKQLIAKMKEKKIDATGVRVLSGSTSSIDIFINPKTGVHRWGTWHPGVLNDYHLEAEDFERFSSFDAVSLVVYGPTKHLVSELAFWGKKRQTRPFLIVNFDDLSQFDHSLDVVTKHIGGIDAGFFGLDHDKDIKLMSELKELAQKTGKLFVVTLGKKGAIAFHRDQTYQAPAHHVLSDLIQDTTGAGDAFLTAFIVSYLKTKGNIQSSLTLGNNFGAQKIQIIGAY